MTEDVKKELEKPEMSEFHSDLLTRVKQLVSRSRGDMSPYYETWDKRHMTYRAERVKDKKDKKAQDLGEPVKQTVPLTYAQVDTFVAFGLMTLFQRKYLFELEPSGTEDFAKENPAEMLLNRDMRYNGQINIVNQLLLDVAKFSLGAIKGCWSEEFDYIPMQVEDKPAVIVMGKEVAPATMKTEWRKVSTWVGNKLFNVSPYRIFPDTRLPLTRYQEGEFLALEEETTFSALKKQEAFGLYAGVKHVQPFNSGMKEVTGKRVLTYLKPDGNDKENVIKTEVFIDLIPSEIKLPEGKALGNEDFPVRYVIEYANDQRVIRCEPYTYLSRDFPVFIAQFSPDQHELINQSLAELIAKPQDVVDWFFNSRVASVTRTLDNQLVIDPSGIQMSTVNSKSRVILMNKQAARQGPSKFVQQLQVTDVTGRHLDDMNTVAGLMPTITGVSENMMGNYSQGRRSAYESRVVTQGTSARGRKVISLLWESCLAPLGQAMLVNLRQGIDFDTYRSVVGDQATEEEWAAFKGTPESLVQNNDLLVFDGTLPSDKLYLSQSLQEILTVLLSNPQAAVQFNLDPKEVMDEMYRLRGVTQLDRFAFKGQSMMNQIMQQVQQQLALQNGTQPGQPGQQPNSPPKPQPGKGTA